MHTFIHAYIHDIHFSRPNITLYVDIQTGRLAFWSIDDSSWTEETLTEILAEFLGPNTFTNVRMTPKGFAIIQFTDPYTAERAIMRLNGLKVRISQYL